jgi:hypothetical protein
MARGASTGGLIAIAVVGLGAIMFWPQIKKFLDTTSLMGMTLNLKFIFRATQALEVRLMAYMFRFDFGNQKTWRR